MDRRARRAGARGFRRRGETRRGSQGPQAVGPCRSPLSMKKESTMRTIVAAIALFASAAAGAAESHAPYAGQQSRDIKSLSEQEIAALLAGQGAGLAKAAELNGYPGPAHV